MFGEIRWRFGENVFSDLEKNCLAKYVGDLEKHGQRFGETRSAKMFKIWRNMVGAVMAISCWSSSWSSVELGDRKWRLNRSGERVETNYGDQNFIHHKVESTYLGCFKDRNV